MKRLLKWFVRIVLVLLILLFLLVFISYWRSTNDCARYSAAPQNPIKAVVYCDYGIANLKYQDIEKPTPTDDQVLVRVQAASINPYDWHFVEGTPKLFRLLAFGLRKPKDTRLGVDFAGVVEAVGKNVTQFKPGDEVFGGKGGAFGQYVTPRADRAIALKPPNVTFEEAASVNIAGLTALQAVRDHGKVQPGQKVLINGASGGVGTFAVQIAKIFGADVTGVCSTRSQSRDRLHEGGLCQERSEVRRDPRQRGEPSAFGKSQAVTSNWKIRVDRRRQRKSAGLDRKHGKTAHSVNHETLR